jgi:hypothetical protein
MNRRELAVILILLGALLLAEAFLPPGGKSDVPVAATTVPASAFVPFTWEPTPAARLAPTPPDSRTVRLVGSSPSVRPSVAPVRITETPVRESSAGSAASVTGTASTYGPGFDGYLALPVGPGIHVRICGAGGCIDRVSNDTGPVPSLHRVADLNVADFQSVSGLPWTRGLCRVSVEVLAP